jgi:hypothetical protein
MKWLNHAMAKHKLNYLFFLNGSFAPPLHQLIHIAVLLHSLTFRGYTSQGPHKVYIKINHPKTKRKRLLCMLQYLSRLLASLVVDIPSNRIQTTASIIHMHMLSLR